MSWHGQATLDQTSRELQMTNFAKSHQRDKTTTSRAELNLTPKKSLTVLRGRDGRRRKIQTKPRQGYYPQKNQKTLRTRRRAEHMPSRERRGCEEAEGGS